MASPFKILRRYAPLREPEVSNWSSALNGWGHIDVVEGNLPTFESCSVSESLTASTSALDESVLLHFTVPEVMQPGSQLEGFETYDASYDLLSPIVRVVNILPSIGPPTTQGSLFVADDSGTDSSQGSLFEKPLGSQFEAKRPRVKPISHVLSNPSELRAYDLFAMLLPILLPPAANEFSDELLFPGELYEFQRAGVKWLFENKVALLADDMGLGKTVQAITAFRALIRRGQSLQALVVCPKSVLSNWQKEIESWAPELLCVRVEGPAMQRKFAWQAMIGKCHVLIATYDTVRLDSEVIAGRPFDLVIADEIQRIKNPTSATSQAIRNLSCRRRWGLTGTPLENTAEDLSAIFSFLSPGLFARGETSGMSLRAIQDRIRPFMLRRRKQDVLKDLPPIVVDTTVLELTESQRKSYDEAERNGVVRLRSEEKLSIQHVLALIGVLKQICNFDPATGESCKTEYLIEEFLPEACSGGQKALIVSQYVQALSTISSEIEEYRPLSYTGSLSSNQRDQVLHNFETDDSRKVLLLSLRAGGVGLNLTRANYLMHFDRWWNPAIEDQATARVHRIGQTKSVFISRLVCKNTIEERIEHLLERKRILFSQVVDELSDVGLQQVLSEEELFGLFGLKPPRRDSRSQNPTERTAIVIDPNTPFSNIVHLRNMLRDSEQFLHWADPHFRIRALEEIAIHIDPSMVKEIRILSGSSVVDDKARREFKRFVVEMAEKGIRTEWRVLDQFSHDRYLMSSKKCFNIPPVGSIFQGSYGEMIETPNRPPFEDWWRRSVSL